jgi:hypothetical protein
VFSAEQSAIIEAIQSEKNNRHEIVIIPASLSTIMATETRTPTKSPNTQSIRKILDHEGPGITLLWVTSHKGIPGNDKADQAAKKALHEDISTTERYPPDDLKKWLTEEGFKKRDQRWKNGNNEIEERKKDDQVAISSLRTGYIRPPTAPRWKGSAIHYVPSVTPIYTVGMQRN